MNSSWTPAWEEGTPSSARGRIDDPLRQEHPAAGDLLRRRQGISPLPPPEGRRPSAKLERTQENLVRIGDKLEELDLQRGPLKAQAQQARQYLDLREELRGLEVSLWMAQLDRQREAGQRPGRRLRHGPSPAGRVDGQGRRPLYPGREPPGPAPRTRGPGGNPPRPDPTE